MVLSNHSVMSDVWVYLTVSSPKGHMRVPINIKIIEKV